MNHHRHHPLLLHGRPRSKQAAAEPEAGALLTGDPEFKDFLQNLTGLLDRLWLDDREAYGALVARVVLHRDQPE